HTTHHNQFAAYPQFLEVPLSQMVFRMVRQRAIPPVSSVTRFLIASTRVFLGSMLEKLTPRHSREAELNLARPYAKLQLEVSVIA
ncbi:hypothetical protein, partial [Haematobacter missouriensis]|uniref:hypothetical protein n=1 Tax=Haematobacter missouriensis TaxID=366616 RepID=UPI0023F44870